MTSTDKPAAPATATPAPVKATASKKAAPATAPKAAAKPVARPAAKAAPKAAVKAKAPAAKKAAVSVTKKPVAKPAAAKPVAAPKVAKVKKPKMVRDSFTIPKPEYDVLDVLKLRAAKLGNPVKKTELIRAGVKAIAALSDAAFKQALLAVPSLKTGRPAKTKKA